MAGSQQVVRFRVDADLYNRVYSKVPWGLFSPMMRALCSMAVDAIERDGPMIAGALASGDYIIVYQRRNSIGEPRRSEESNKPDVESRAREFS